MALLVVASTAAWAWYVWLPNNRPALHHDEQYGIDVSSHQGAITWSKVAHDGIKAAYIKATEGGDYVDSRFAANWASARQAGVRRGAYHFFTLCRPGADQAQNFLATVPADADAMAPAVDLEIRGNCSKRPKEADVQRELGVFLQQVEARSGKPAVFYVDGSFERLYHPSTAFPRQQWARQILQRPANSHWLVWQVQGYAHVAGISGPVDLDVFKKSA